MKDILSFVLYGDPRTKKNSQRIIKVGNFYKIKPSKAFEKYEKECLPQLQKIYNGEPLKKRYNMKCIYYMKTRRVVDLVNLLEATCDILITAKVIEDDNKNILYSHDGSRVRYDKDNPRVEITISEVDEDF